MKNTIAFLFLLMSTIGMAQEQLNDYKYIIVPKKFDGFKKENQHQTSTLVKYLFSEKGFLTAYEDDLPNELNNNRCLGLSVNLIDDSSMFTTKAGLALEDCQGREVFATKQGKSKEKEFKASFGEAIREAFASIDTFNYSYNGKAENSDPVTVSFGNDVKTMNKEEEQKSITAKNRNAMVEQEATLENQSYKDNRPKPSDFKKGEEKKKMVEQVATQEQQSYKDDTPKTSNFKKSEPVASKMPIVSKTQPINSVLYAQELPNGYQLVDSSPKIRLRIYESSLPNHYLAEGENTNGMVFEKDGKWFFEYYSGENLISEELDIKF